MYPENPVDALPPTDSVHLLGLINPLLRQRRVVVFTVLVIAVVMLGAGFLKARTYTSSSSFMVEGRRGNNLQGIAAQFGIVVPTQDASQSPNFYADLLTNRTILAPVVDSPFVGLTDPALRGKSLATILKINDDSPARREAKMISEVRKRVTTTVAQRTGVVTFNVTTTSAQLSWAIAQRMLDAMNRFNLQTRQSQAAAERKFTETRLAEGSAELRRAEDNLLRFTQQNRDIRNAPALQVQQERLQREVSLRQQVTTTLAQAVEQSKIEEVRDTPVISVIDQPIVPPLPTSRGLVALILSALLVGGVLGSILALIRDRARRGADDATDLVEFRRLLAECRDDMRRPWRLLGRGSSRSNRPD